MVRRVVMVCALAGWLSTGELARRDSSVWRLGATYMYVRRCILNVFILYMRVCGLVIAPKTYHSPNKVRRLLSPETFPCCD